MCIDVAQNGLNMKSLQGRIQEFVVLMMGGGGAIVTIFCEKFKFKK